MRLSDHFVLGLTLGYARSEADLIDGGKITSDGGKAAVYALYHHGGFYTEALVGGGTNSYDTRRAGLGGRAYGDTDGRQFDAYLGLGYDLHLSRVTLTPMASLLYTQVGIDGFDERGSLAPLHIESQEQDSLRSRVGLRAAYTATLGAARVTPSFSAQWQHEYLETELPIDARFANGAGGVFTVHGPEAGPRQRPAHRRGEHRLEPLRLPPRLPGRPRPDQLREPDRPRRPPRELVTDASFIAGSAKLSARHALPRALRSRPPFTAILRGREGTL